jgi:hypothetical protein
MKRFVIITAILSIPTQVALAQERLDIRGADAETAAQVAEIAATAARRGLPSEAVINEARFAALFKVPGSRIVVAARSVAERLEVAREALQPDPAERDIVAGAEALKYDIPAETLREIRKAYKGPAAVPIGLLIGLIAEPNKVPPKRAAAIVVDLVRRGADTKMIADLGNDVSTDVRRGMSPEQSLAFHLQPLLGPGASVINAESDALAGAANGPPNRKKP